MKLLLADMPVEVQDGKLVQRKRQSYSWAAFMDGTHPVHLNVRLSCFKSILNDSQFQACNQDLLRELVFAKDIHGREVIQITDEASRQYINSRLYYCGRYEIFEGPSVHVSSTAVVVMAYDHGICAQVVEENAKHGKLDFAGFVSCNEILGPSLSKNMGNAEHGTREEITAFSLWDTNGDGLLSMDEYLRYCAQQFGKIKVAMKFMKNAEEYKREVQNRTSLDAKYVLSFLPSVKEETFQADLKNLRNLGGYSMADYPHVVVMPAADRSLDDIYRKERPNESERRNLLQQVAEALQYLHSKELVHGDVKKLNVVRVDNHLKLIDLDATTDFGAPRWLLLFVVSAPRPMSLDDETYTTIWISSE
ncbi:hypothetical protein As57867_025114, partial [Aphanomyces stellatus]